MTLKHLKNGDPFGAHRVIEPEGVLPQPADRINSNMDIMWDNEILVDVEMLNIDSASFTQIENEAGGDRRKIEGIIMDTVEKRGKMHNPVTGSGGVLSGSVAEIGAGLAGKDDLQKGDKIVTLVSLSLTPLTINRITNIKSDIEQIYIEGKAILFESSIFAKLPVDLPASLAMAVLDVCGAPAQTARLVNPGDTVVIVGAGGKSGILCAHEAQRATGQNGKVIGIGHSMKSIKRLEGLDLCDAVLSLDARNATACCEHIAKMTGGKLADLVINCVNIPDTELASILMCRNRGKIYFFSMATSFTKAALGAEGVGKDIDMIIGNGYVKGHAETALNILRSSQKIRALYESLYLRV